MSQYGREYFEWYDSKIQDSGIHFGIADAIHRAFPDQWPVLDVGCGRGYLVQHLVNLYPEAAGIDISVWAVKNPVIPGLPLSHGDVSEHLPWADHRFATVITWQLLEHMPTEEAARRAVIEMGRVSGFMQLHSICLSEESHEDPTHLLIRPRDWWIRLFGKLGWYVDPCLQETLIKSGNWTGNPELFVLRKQ